jgi:fatty-acid desaturase
LWNGTFLVNSYAHWRGDRLYDRKDTSTNSRWVSLITGGEGWHNNHHQAPASMWQGFFKGEIDITAGVICVMEKLKLVWDLREPSFDILKLGMETALKRGELKIPKRRFLKKYPELMDVVANYRRQLA